MADGPGRKAFNGFEFDPATGRLTRENAVILLEFQPSKLLARLLESPDTVVSRDEIDAFAAAGFAIDARDDRWGGRTFLLVFTVS